MRLGHLSSNRPKPLVPVCDRPILHRVLDHAIKHGFDDFVLGLGYRSEEVRAYFSQASDCHHVSVASEAVHQLTSEGQSDQTPRIATVDTGSNATKVERLMTLAPALSDGTFVLSYCDGLSNIDLTEMMQFHRAHGGLMTIAAVHGRDRFGIMDLDGDQVSQLREKPVDYDRWINGGLFILEPEIFDFLKGGQSDWETGAVQQLIADKQAFAYRHDGWWECLDRPEDIPLVERALMLEQNNTAKVAAQ